MDQDSFSTTTASTDFDDLYKVMELEPDASFKEIRTRFKKLSLKYHPDKIQDETQRSQYESMYELISLAYAVLSNPETRREYDQMYYIQKRIGHDHHDLKQAFNTTNQNKSQLYGNELASMTKEELKAHHESVILERHKDLINVYKERDAKEYMTKWKNALHDVIPNTEITRSTRDAATTDIVKTENVPLAVIPATVVKYQEIQKVGEMYSSEPSNMDRYIEGLHVETSGKIDTPARDLDVHIDQYKDQTVHLYSLDTSEYSFDGEHMLLDKIIV